MGFLWQKCASFASGSKGIVPTMAYCFTPSPCLTSILNSPYSGSPHCRKHSTRQGPVYLCNKQPATTFWPSILARNELAFWCILHVSLETARDINLETWWISKWPNYPNFDSNTTVTQLILSTSSAFSSARSSFTIWWHKWFHFHRVLERVRNYHHRNIVCKPNQRWLLYHAKAENSVMHYAP